MRINDTEIDIGHILTLIIILFLAIRISVNEYDIQTNKENISDISEVIAIHSEMSEILVEQVAINSEISGILVEQVAQLEVKIKKCN